jgi:hypothetical protein
MTGSQQQPQPGLKGLDIEHWKLETRNGSRLLSDSESALGVTTVPSFRGRIACTVVTVCYFAYLWFVAHEHPTLSFVVTFVYFYLMVDRWRDAKVENLSFIQFISLVHAGGDQATPLVQFGILAPALFLCIAPSGIGQTLRQFDRNRRIGRSTFILTSIPALLLLAAPYWPNLDLALVQSWNLIGAPIDAITPWVASLGATLIMIWVLNGRLLDIDAGKWLRISVWGFVGAHCAIAVLSSNGPYLLSADLLLVTAVLGLCLWPSRADRAETTPTS